MNSSTNEMVIFCMNYLEKNTMDTNFEPHECVSFVQSTKIGTHENKAIHSTLGIWLWPKLTWESTDPMLPTGEGMCKMGGGGGGWP